MAKKKFTIAVSNGAIGTYEGDFEISKEGVLIVNPAEGDSDQLIYAPHAWLCVDIKKN